MARSYPYGRVRTNVTLKEKIMTFVNELKKSIFIGLSEDYDPEDVSRMAQIKASKNALNELDTIIDSIDREIVYKRELEQERHNDYIEEMEKLRNEQNETNRLLREILNLQRKEDKTTALAKRS